MAVDKVSGRAGRTGGRAAPPLWQAGLLAGVLAVVANLILFTLGSVLGTSFLVLLSPGATELTPVSPMMVAIMSFVPAILATLLFALLRRSLARPVGLFVGISVVLLLLSLAGPLASAVDAATRMVLASMHVLAAAVIVGVLVRAHNREVVSREGAA